MTFAINPSLNYIDIPEQAVYEMYRSKSEILLSDTRFRGHPCEAYICISRIEKIMKAYVALLEMGMKTVFVYTSDYSAETIADYPKVLAEADEFVRSIGFSMDKVNLEFSPAMREVIIKGIRVMRPPAKKTVLKSSSGYHAGPDTVPMKPHPLTEKSASSIKPPYVQPVELQRLQAEIASAKALIEKMTRDKLAFEQNASREIATLKAAAEKDAEAKIANEARRIREIESLKNEKPATADKERINQLESALDRAEASGRTLTDETCRLTEKIAKLETEKLQLEDISGKEKSRATGEILKLTAEIESLNSLLSAEKNLAADKIASLAFFETSWKESQQREEDFCRNLDIMKGEIDLLEAELATLHLQDGREAALLLEIADLKIDVKGLFEAKNDIEAEYIRMAKEAMGKETEMLEALYSADAEIIRLSREIELQHRVAEMEKSAMRDELQKVLVSGSASLAAADPFGATAMTAAATSSAPLLTKTSPTKVVVSVPESSPDTTPLSSSAAESSPAVSADDDTPDESVAGDPQIIAGLVNEFGSFCGSSGYSATEFKIDPDIDKIEYSDPAEIAAVLYSSNSVQAVPDGSRIQRCKGYVIATKKAGEYRAYVAWYLTESDSVVICTPEQQPADAAECSRIIQDAVAYFEIVGFMMEIEDLGSTVKSYNRAIRKIPALTRQ